MKSNQALLFGTRMVICWWRAGRRAGRAGRALGSERASQPPRRSIPARSHRHCAWLPALHGCAARRCGVGQRARCAGRKAQPSRACGGRTHRQRIRVWQLVLSTSQGQPLLEQQCVALRGGDGVKEGGVAGLQGRPGAARPVGAAAGGWRAAAAGGGGGGSLGWGAPRAARLIATRQPRWSDPQGPRLQWRAARPGRGGRDLPLQWRGGLQACPAAPAPLPKVEERAWRPTASGAAHAAPGPTPLLPLALASSAMNARNATGCSRPVEPSS